MDFWAVSHIYRPEIGGSEMGSLKSLGWIWACATLCILNTSPWAHSEEAAPPKPVTITLLHTNDLHSHFRAEKTLQGLGGIARIKTAINGVRSKTPDALLLDGGDWSEGNIYYTLGGGTETLKMMDWLGYDVALVGNHDWLNGPDNLLDSYAAANPSLKLLATNVDVSGYARRKEFTNTIHPIVVKQVQGIKIAFIGVLTEEKIYHRFIEPVKVTNTSNSIAFKKALKFARSQADIVVGISHNAISKNVDILKDNPQLDFIVGAHDHVQLQKPLMVPRTGANTAWIIETGSWGRNLGKLELEFQPAGFFSTSRLAIKTYNLIQMDQQIPEDPETLRRVGDLEAVIEKNMGPVFHDEVAENFTEVNRASSESLVGNLATDAYLSRVNADFALDQTNFVYGELHPGKLTSADFFNFNPAVFNPKTQKAWTLKTFPMKGRDIKFIFGLLFGFKNAVPVQAVKSAGVSASGLSFNYAPVLTWTPLSNSQLKMLLNQPEFDFQPFGIEDIEIRGKPLDPNRTYTAVAGDGIIYAIETINSYFPGLIPLGQLKDTGLEDWRVIMDYVKNISPLTPDKIPVGNRIRTLSEDLAVLTNEISWSPVGTPTGGTQTAKLTVNLKNLGASDSGNQGQTIQILGNTNGSNFALEPNWLEIGKPQKISSVKPGDSRTFQWNVKIPGDHGLYPIKIKLNQTGHEINQSNDEVIKWFSVN